MINAALETPVSVLLAEHDRRKEHAPLLKSLMAFTEAAWSQVEPYVKFRTNWHIEALADALERVTKGETKRLICNVPPGCMKSLLCSVFWPCWEWASQPHLRYLCASHSDALAIRDNLRVRDIVTSDWYRERFPLRLVDFQREKRLFTSVQGGFRQAVGVSGQATGIHPDRIIVDDPLRLHDAHSDAERERVLHWFDRSIATRGLVRDVRVVIIMQRLHENDLSGHLLERGGWDHICFPMRFEPDRADPLDQRTEPDQLLWPSMFSESTVARLETDLGPYGTAGQLQQRPAPEGAGLFQRDWFELVDALPADAQRCRGWDTAATPGGGDWTVGVKIAQNNGHYYIEDVRRGQLSAAAVDSLIAQTTALDGKRCKQREEQEPGSSGKAVIAARARTLAGFDYGGVATTGQKVVRAGPFRAQAQAGNVKILRAPWTAAYLDELETFPVGVHDDQIDASSCAFNELTSGPGPLRMVEARWG